MKEKITRVTLEDIRSGKPEGETDWDRMRAMTGKDAPPTGRRRRLPKTAAE